VKSAVVRPSASGAVRGLSWAALVLVAGLIARAEARRPAPPEGVVAYADLVYRRADGFRAALDVFAPDGPAPAGGFPVILAIHGGGWSGGSKGGFGRDVARLERHGYVVVSVAYRLSRPGEPSWPRAFEDVREAVRWVRRHGREFAADPGRIVALGASAGGHLAALLGTYPDDPTPPGATSARVQAVVVFYGPADLEVMYGESPRGAGPIAQFLGGPPERVPGRYLAASSIRHASADDPPMLLIQGQDDPTVPPDQALRLAEALGYAGVPHRVILLPGAAHGFGFRAAGRDLEGEILAFLDDLWKHSGRLVKPLARPEIDRERPRHTRQ
jgi:acetyl esterase/lipase